MFAIIDLETTGKSARHGKITEIAIYLHDGLRIVDEYSTLINPEERVTAFITGLTGITNEMLVNAPKFYEVAKKVVEFTEGAVFVAHNVGFDYGFMREEFKRLGYPYERETLCTARLSRKLIPGHRSYSLGKLCANLGIELEDRHRAYGDALATVKLFELLLSRDQHNLINKQKTSPFSYKDLHPELPRERIDALPQATGVYYFRDDSDRLIYVGKSTNIRQRVLNHLSNHKTKRAVEMCARIAQVDYETTGSELIALLKESDEIKTLKPLYNRAQRKVNFQFGVYARYNSKGYLCLYISDRPSVDPLVTSFATKSEARNQLTQLAEKHELCRKLCDLFGNSGPCFHHLIHQCKGACVDAEDSELYNKRVQAGIQSLKKRFRNLLIIDQGRDAEERSVILFEDGNYLGYGYLPVEEAIQDPDELKTWIKPKLDNREVHSIVWNYLKKNRVERSLRF